jgi:hypothetical protein
MHAAAATPARRERDVERLLGQPGGELAVGELGPLGLQRGLDALLGRVEGETRGLALLGRKLAERGTESRKLPGLAEVAGLYVLQRNGIAGRRELRKRALDDAVEGANG